MLSIVTCRSINSTPSLFVGQFRLRHQQFIARQNYAVKTIEGLEFDEYDTLAASYLVYSEDGKTVLGCSRLTPIAYGCMLRDHFPDMVDDHSLFETENVWEGTRFCIDNNLPAEKRQTILKLISVAYLEYALHHNIPKIIGLMPTLILRTVFERNGIELQHLGPIRQVGDHARIRAAAIEVSSEQYVRACQKTGLESPLGLLSPEGSVRHVA
jgi:acyl homoserine lactone synthase